MLCEDTVITNEQEAVHDHAKAPKFTPDERNAMRSYLQRAEVRLSTMHRVAVGFLSGAGLLFLFPVFLKDGVLTTIRLILNYTPDIAKTSQFAQPGWIILVCLCLFYPFILSLGIPALALILLVKDTIRFYFTGHPPSFPADHFNPRFILTGIAFSPDESEQVKARVLRYEYGTDLINFVISHADGSSRYYSDIIDKPHRKIVPRTRKLPKLVQEKIVHIPENVTLNDLEDNSPIRVHGMYTANGEEEAILPNPHVERTLKDIDRFNAALGLAGFIDRSLYQEVAKAEVSLVRHALKLRTLVLRYFQALLILIWTSAVTLLSLPFLEHKQFSLLAVWGVTYFIWALFAPFIVRLPVFWLLRLSRLEVQKNAFKQLQKSDALQSFGILTRRFCYFALFSSALAIILEIAMHAG
jgi:hypothetical protein